MSAANRARKFFFFFWPTNKTIQLSCIKTQVITSGYSCVKLGFLPAIKSPHTVQWKRRINKYNESGIMTWLTVIILAKYRLNSRKQRFADTYTVRYILKSTSITRKWMRYIRFTLNSLIWALWKHFRTDQNWGALLIHLI